MLAQRSFAVSAQQINFYEFSMSGQTFSVNIKSGQNLTSDNLMFGNSLDVPPTGSISIPNNLPVSNSTKITNAVFISDSLFLRRDNRFTEVGSVVISSTAVGVGTIQNLDTPVTLSFQISPVTIAK